MSAHISLDQRAELIKLGDVLGVTDARLEFLGDLDAAVLRELRERSEHWLHEGHERLFRKLATASRLLPAALLVRLGEQVFGPMLVARIAGAMDTGRAVDVALRMSVPFLADVCRFLDPERASAILRALPAAAVRDVALELLRRKQYVVMGRFLDNLSPEALEAIVAGIGDEAALLRIGFFVESRRRIGEVIDLLDDSRLRALVRAAHGPGETLWREALTLALHIDADRRARFVDLMADESVEWLGELLAITQELELWPALLTVLADARPAAQRKLLGLPAVAREDVLRELLAAARELDDPARFLDLADALPESHRRALRAVTAGIQESPDSRERTLLAELEKRIGSKP